MAAIVDLLQRTSQWVRRCPEPTLVQAYRDAARAFCRESQWLRRTLDPITTEADQQTYDLMPVESGQQLEVVNVRTINAQGFSPLQQWSLSPADPTTWDVNLQPEQPRWYGYIPENSVALWPVPDQAYTLTVVAVVQPVLQAEELPDDLLVKWDQVLTDGALAYLLEIEGQPWSNPNLAARRRVMFQAGINNAKADQQRAYNTGTVMARARAIFEPCSIASAAA